MVRLSDQYVVPPKNYLEVLHSAYRNTCISAKIEYDIIAPEILTHSKWLQWIKFHRKRRNKKLMLPYLFQE